MTGAKGRFLSCRATPARLEVVAAAGIERVEISLPAPDRVSELRAALAANRLAVSSVQIPLDVRQDLDLAGLATSFEAIRDLGATYVFTGSRADENDLANAYRRLRQAGDLAAQAGLTIVLETHPNLAQNGERARQTMEAVAHPNVRINYDTANVHYYNHGVDSVVELRKALPYVAALHLKDTLGGFESFEFPALGQGIVDFPAVFGILDEVGFVGPTTLEIEFERHPDPEGEFARILRESVDYLRRIGAYR